MKTIALFVGLILYVQSVPHLNAAVLIATNATWKYLDNGTDQGTAWRSTGYNDSGWAAGPAELGYGELDEATVVGFGPDQNNKYITTYFRRAFNVSSPGSFSSLTLRLERDDGAVVYLNGAEIYRDSMPTGAVNYATLASSATEGGTYVTVNLGNALTSGGNVLAVEMHQFTANSTDLSFSLELIGEEPQPLVMRLLNFDAAGAHLAVEGAPGSSVTIQYSADTINWVPLFSGTIGPSGVLLHTNAFAGQSRAYRAAGDGGGGVYSVNIVAVYQLSIAPGYAMIGNHLFDTNNSVAALLPSPPPGTSIYKIGSDNRFAVNNYLQGWSDTAMMLRPGDGVFIRNPTASAMTVAFKGELPQGTLVNQLPAGFTICSSIVPQSGQLQTLLQFPAADDDTIYVFNGAGYSVYNYFFGDWSPAEPGIGVGQAFWSLKGAAVNWSRNFSVSGGGGNYTATQFAAASSVAQVNFLTYNTDTNKGRVLLSGGLTPVSSNFFGQLYAGTAASEASLVAIGSPTQFLGDAGYIRSGTVVVPSASPNDSRFFQLRAWDITSGTNYEAAVGGTRGKSAIFSVVVGGGLQVPPDASDFSSFTVTGNPPAITAQPMHRVVPTGSNAQFNVAATGNQPLFYHWFFNQTNVVSVSTNSPLTVTNVQSSSTGRYSVVVSNAVGTATSAVALLSIPATSDQTVTLLNPTNSTWRYLADGSDQGTIWSQSAYNDSTWPTGLGLFGTETPGVYPYPIQAAFPPPSTGGPITVYFRAHFQWNDNPAHAIITASNYIDDGAVFYLNGVEFQRFRVPPAQNYQTLAGNRPTEGQAEVFTFAATNVLMGDNVLAVELHQATAASTDAVFGMGLTASLPFGPIITDAAQPTNRTVLQGTSTTLNVTAAGSPSLSYQWFKDGAPIADATNSAYVIASMTAGNAGDYSCRVSTSISSVDTRHAAVTYQPDVAPPILVFANGLRDRITVIVSFSEPVANPFAEEIFSYTIAPAAGGDAIAVISAIVSLATNVVLTTEPRTNVSYTLTVDNVPDLFENFIAPGSQIPIADETLLLGLDLASVWKYEQSDTDLGTVWRQPGFDDSAWPTGAPLFDGLRTGIRSNVSAQIVRTFLTVTNATGTNNKTAFYFRAPFNFTGNASNSLLRIHPFVDDGAAFYLNGQEALRLGMPPGPITHGTLANRSLGNATFEGPFDLPLTNVITGVNVLAVEVHQVTLTSSDITFGAELLASVPGSGSAPPTITTQPQSQTVAAGNPAQFSVTATGTPPLTYQWRKEGINIPGATSSVFAIPNAQSPDQGTYDVVVNNAFGSAASSVATLAVLIAPTITQQPYAQAVTVGANARFRVTASGALPLPLGFRWRRGGATQTNFLLNAHTSDYVINNVQTNHAGTYSVVVSNQVGMVLSSNAVLTVLADTDADGLPDSWEVAHGLNPNNAADASFDPDGDGTTNLEEYRADTNPYDPNSVLRLTSISAGTALQFFARSNVHYFVEFSDSLFPPAWSLFADIAPRTTNRTINLIDPTFVPSRYYRLLAWRSFGDPPAYSVNVLGFVNVNVASSTNVVTRPLLNSFPDNTVGTMLPNPPDGTCVYKWIPATQTYEVTCYFDGAWDSPSLLIQPGETFIMINPGASFTLTFLGEVVPASAPVITTQPQNQIAVAGSNATFSVTADGTSPLTYQWFKDGLAIPGATAATYTINSVSASDAATYFVEVSNAAGTVTSANATLTVRIPPLITAQPQNQTLVVGSNGTFSVTATGDPPLAYQWFFNGTAMAGATAATLALNNVQPPQAGSYRVVVSNAAGSVTSVLATLTVTQRGLIAAESFVYPVGSIVGLDGGVGFRGAYTGGGLATSNSLAYTDTNGAALPTAGGRYLAMPNPYQPASRDFDTNGQPGAKFGEPGSIIYVGFLVRLDSGTNAGLGWGGVSLLDGAIERVFFGDPGFEGQLNWGVDRQLGSNNVRQSAVPVDFQTHLLVGRIDFDAEAATVRLYVDPPLNREPSVASVTPFATPPFRFTTLRIASSPNGFAFDEIKVGTSYDDVVQAVAGAGPEILVNGSFELPALAQNTSSTDTPTGWMWNGTHGWIVNGNGGGSPFGSQWPLAPHGQQYVDIGVEYILSQSFTINVPGQYRLTWSDNTAFPAGTNSIPYSPYSVTILNASTQSMATATFDAGHGGIWFDRSLILGLAPGTYSIVFGDNGLIGTWDALIDNVSLRLMPPCLPPPSGLVGWWRGEGDVLDAVGGNHGVLSNGTAFLTGHVGQALSFDGSNDFVRVSDVPSLRFSTSITVAAWVRLDAYASTNRNSPILHKDPQAGGGRSYYFAIGDGRIDLAVFGTGHDVSAAARRSDVSLALGQWHHVVGVYRGGASPYLDVYVDGTLHNGFLLLNSGSIPSSIHENNHDVFVGAYVDGIHPFPSHFDGLIDEVALFNRALSSSEIAAIYAAGSAGKCPPPQCVTPPPDLIAWYPMDGSANDISGHGNNGIVRGATLIADRFGVPNSAYTFDGVDDFIEVPDNGSFSFTWPVSLVAWVNPLDTSKGGIVGQWGYGGAPDAYLLSLSSNRVMSTFPADGNFQTTSSGTLPLSNWTHVVMTFDGATVRYFINGAASGTFAASPIANSDINEPLIIGLENIILGNLNYFHGSLDDVLIFNRALSSNEIAAIYSAGSAGMCPPQSLQVTVRGAGNIIVNPQSQTYPFGSMVMISAVPDRYHTFLHWSDGNTNSLRTISVGLNNDYTAIFTNSVPLETRTVKLWDRSFGGSSDDYNPVMKSTSDGGVIVVAQTQSDISGNKATAICSPGNWAAWVLKLDANGNKQWEQTIGMPSDFSVLYGVTQTSDGGYALGGYVAGTPVAVTNNCGRAAPGFGGYDLWLVRLGTNGQRLWDRSFGGDGIEGAYAIVPTADGGLLLAGDSDSPTGTNKIAAHYGGGDGWIVRVDAAGNQLWDRSFGGTGYDVFGAAALLPDGGFLLAGSSSSPPGGNKTSPAYGSNDFWAVRVDANGNKLWEESYGGDSYDALLGLSLMPDGGAVLSGFSSSVAAGTRTSASFGPDDYWVVRIEANGNQVWDRAFGGTGDADWGYRTLPADDGGLTVCGFSNSGVSGNKTTPLFGLSDGWAVRLDAYGNKIGEFAAGGPSGNSFTDLGAAVNGEIFFAGDSDSGPGGNKTSPHWGALDVWVVKAVARTAPVGTPVILVNGRIDPSNTVSVTNSALLEIQSSFPNASIFFTLDGSDPDQGEIYTGPLVLTSDAIVRAVAYTADFQTSAEADPVVVLVARAPVIIVDPQSQVVAAGVTVTFSVVASGEEPLRYQWFKGEAELSGQTNATLFIPGAQTSDAGLYSVAVANARGLVHSDDAALGIIEPPMITMQPTNVSVMLSNTVMFCVDATGGDPLQYQWRRNGGNIPNETSRCLEISPVTLGDGGTYDVIIANAVAAVVSQPAVLRLILPAAAAGDNFAGRVSLDNLNRVNGIIQSTNVGATKEPGEPNHGGKPGGSSVWYRWTAPFDGIAAFRTLGSSFDTLLAVYTGSNVSNLTVIASDEDSGGFLTSLVRFSAVANREYAIAVDGFGDTEGEFALSWELAPNANPLPVVLQQPQSQTVTLGTNVLFSVVASNAATFLWFRNGTPLYAQTTPQLIIPAAGPGDVGTYRVAITNNAGEGIQSETAILQIAFGFETPGTRSADKIEDLSVPSSASAPGLRAGKKNDFTPEVRAGSTGVQILNNTAAGTAVGENNLCNVIGGRSEWFQIRALANATMRIDTVGSAIDTILSVYRGTNVLIAPGLVAVPGGCDDDSGPNKTSIVRFSATNGVDYSIQVDGKNGTNGIVYLNLGLGFAPSNSQPASRLVARQGDNITLNCTAVGTPDPMFFWYRSNQTASAAFVAVTATGSLPLSNLQPDKQGTYTVIVSNFIASITNTIAEVVVQTNALIAAQTGFDSTMDGWTAITNGGALDLRHSGAGGNPGGHLAVRTIPIEGSWYWVAPAAYLGNKFYCYNGSLSFELRQTITDSLALLPGEDVILEGAGQRLVINLNNPTASIWTTYRVSLNESPSVGWRLGSLAGPTVTREQLLAVLTSLTNLMIRGAAGSGTEVGQIDSVLLLGSTTPALSIRADSSDWLIEWPQALAGFSLQTVTAFQPAAATPQVDQWIGTTQPPTLTNSLNSVRVPGLPTQQFFRLHKPAP